MITKEDRDKILDEIGLLASVPDGMCSKVVNYAVVRRVLNSLTQEDEPKWLQEAGYCGTCAYFHREPRCQGGICGGVISKPQVKIINSCDFYETDKEYENYWDANAQEDECPDCGGQVEVRNEVTVCWNCRRHWRTQEDESQNVTDSVTIRDDKEPCPDSMLDCTCNGPHYDDKDEPKDCKCGGDMEYGYYGGVGEVCGYSYKCPDCGRVEVE